MKKLAKRPRADKPYTEMNTRELAEATREFDEPFVIDRGRPLAPRCGNSIAAPPGEAAAPGWARGPSGSTSPLSVICWPEPMPLPSGKKSGDLK